MKIAGIVVHEISADLDRPYWMSLEPYRTASEIIVQIATDSGTVGIGEIHGRPLGTIARIVADVLAPRLMGRDPLDKEALWDEMFSLAHSREGAVLNESEGQPHFGAGLRPQLMAAIAGIDLALWDVVARSHAEPMWRFLGGSSPRVLCYASGGYYGESGEADTESLVGEMRGYVEAGYSAVKMKVGGLTMEQDSQRVAAVRDAVGSSIEIMIDANSAYSPGEAVRAAQIFEPLEIRWFEEPVHWYDSIRGLRDVAESTSIPIASGESEIHRFSARDLIELGGASIMQFDATRAGGMTEWLKVQSHAASHGVGMAPHHDPQIHGHMIAAAENGLIQEVFPNPARDPLWRDLFIGQPEISDGTMVLSERPGFGFSLHPEALARYGRKSWQLGNVDAIANQSHSQ
jgi:L-alanine-DL-glutamate epimerase-like enolase superfamily enzyme